MTALSKNPPGYAYGAAVFVGAVCLPFIILLAAFLTSPNRGGSLWLFAALVATGHAVLGALFGLIWPERKWRWGVWLCAGPTLLFSFQAVSAWFFLGWVAVTLLPACLGAHATGRAHLNTTTVDRSRLTTNI